MDWMAEALAALVPSLGVGLIFWFVMRAVIHADRRERAAIAQLEAEERARLDDQGNSRSSVEQQH